MIIIDQRSIDQKEIDQILAMEEGHIIDFNEKDIQPAKIQETFVAFSNADGGDFYKRIEDKKYTGERVRPFLFKEDANEIINVLLKKTDPSVEDVKVELISIDSGGHILQISIPKSPKVHYTASGECFLRLNALKIKIKGDRVTYLAYSKGSAPYERVDVDSVSINEIANSIIIKDYMCRIQTSLSELLFLKKQRIISEKGGREKPNVGCVLLFDEEPQATVETRCAVKIYRLRTTEAEYKREHLAEPPSTINGPVEILIRKTIEKIKNLLEGVSVYEDSKLVPSRYPAEAIK